jgi:hypothetical protein
LYEKIIAATSKHVPALYLVFAQEMDLTRVISQNSPYQQPADITTTLSAMENWKSSEWSSFWNVLN